jgi:hypothetical protein
VDWSTVWHVFKKQIDVQSVEESIVNWNCGSAFMCWWDYGINIDEDSHWLRSDTDVLSLWRINISSRKVAKIITHIICIPTRVIKSPWKNSSALREEYIFCVLKTPYLDNVIVSFNQSNTDPFSINIFLITWPLRHTLNII